MNDKKCCLSKLTKTKISLCFKIFYFFLFMTPYINVEAQNEKNNDGIANRQNIFKTISFGEKIFFGTIENSAQWTVKNTDENSSEFLTGNAINNYVFEKPGIYEIQFSENKKHSEECNHPPFTEKMIIEVTKVKMTFNFSEINFSEKIKSGVSYEDVVITVPVTVKIKDDKSLEFNIQEFSVAGVGSELKATPLNKSIKLTTGRHLIKYKLSGIVKTQTYLMFDFIDFNSNVQTYNQPEIVN